ncbi:MAG: C39 family peptidase [Candidatus Kerfeldbacteria bacterium]|nr:C39 family peptidase [Candidatus Kerfeldbacteria bacterium]
MRKGLFTFNLLLIVFIVAGLAYLGRHRVVEVWDNWMSEPAPEPVSFSEIVNEQRALNANAGSEANQNINTASVVTEPTTIPNEFNLALPFTTQAPFANWDYPYQEACEEASALTVHYYYAQKTFSAEIADREILDLVAWEEDILGYYKDTTAEETARVIKEYWGYQRVDVEYDPTIDQIKRHVAAGRPVIIPAAGKQLGNPNFRNGGPLYHMFVVRGYTADTFVTNDVGTRKGENYIYDIDVVMSAMHDWNGGDVDNGRKAIVVVYPND